MRRRNAAGVSRPAAFPAATHRTRQPKQAPGAEGRKMSRIHAMWGIGQLVARRAVDKAAATAIASRLAGEGFSDRSR